MKKNIHIDAVTVVTADTRRPDLAVRALERCLEKISFFDTIAFTPKNYRYTGHHPIRTVEIEEMKSSADYSNFIVSTLPDFIKTSHVLITQWDGYILNPERWDPEFLEYDYIGATWPQFTDNHNVGNGGFSLRSYKLMKAVREISPPEVDPEDFVICRTLRKNLEKQHNIRFAPTEIAERFSVERSGSPEQALGFHGLATLAATTDLHELSKLMHSLPASVFASTEGRGLIKNLLTRGATGLARQALHTRTTEQGMNISNARLWARVKYAEFFGGKN